MGKTPSKITRHRAGQKHPHVHGEDYIKPVGCALSTETPPRAWGRQAMEMKRQVAFGNTPTCMGKTLTTDWPTVNMRKHPHVHGEDRT